MRCRFGLKPLVWVAVFLFSGLFSGVPAWGKDYPQPLIDPSGPLPRIDGMFHWEHALYAATEWDSFHFRTANWGTLVGTGSVFLQYYFDSILLAGPLSPGENPTAIVAFWLNSVQFEYGIRGTYLLEDGTQIYLEYSRRSLHPLRPVFSETTYDVLALGGGSAFLFHGVLVALQPQISWLQLFPFWQSHLPVSREFLRGELGWDVSVEVPDGVGFFIGGRKSLILTRFWEFGWEINSELGVRVFGPQGRGEVFIQIYSSDDTEILRKSRHRDFQFGLGVRLAR